MCRNHRNFGKLSIFYRLFSFSTSLRFLFQFCPWFKSSVYYSYTSRTYMPTNNFHQTDFLDHLEHLKGTIKRLGFGRKLGSFNRSSLKREVGSFLEKSTPPPILWELFKVLERPLNFDVGGENSVHTWMKSSFFIPQFTIVNAPI
jgi:hypothetical protein